MKTKWMMKAAVMVASTMMAAEPSYALSCDPPSIERSYKKSDWVFLAEVLEAKNTYNVKDSASHKSLQKLKLKVLNTWKGAPPETMELEVYTTLGTLVTARPTPLEAHQAYIFAFSGEQTIPPFSFRTDCDPPWLASTAEKEINWLSGNKGEQK